jgi:hypothetical protein
MPTLAGRSLFTIGNRSYVWEDLVAAGCLWGDWATLEERVRDGLICLARLDDLDDDDEDGLSEEEVDAAAAEFRYARDLVAADDLEAWLEQRGLTIDGWLDFIRRSLLLERWAEDLDEIREEYEADDDEVAETMVCEAVCSGVAGRLVERLAGRAAIHTRATEEAAASGDAVDDKAAASLAAAVPDDQLERFLPDVAAKARRERVAAVASLEVAWRRFAELVAPPDALRGLIASRRLDWVRIATASVVVTDEDVAREIALCVKEDGRPIEEVAEEAGLSADSNDMWLEDADETLRDALIGAQPGDVLGPLTWKEGHLVLTVGDKRLPSDDDPDVRARAEHALLARTVEREVANRVTWHGTL